MKQQKQQLILPNLPKFFKLLKYLDQLYVKPESTNTVYITIM